MTEVRIETLETLMPVVRCEENELGLHSGH
jgi:hypothetical protein